MSEGPELAIFMWNNENLKHTAWLLIRHTETMWDRSQTSNLELKCSFPPPPPTNHQCNSSKVDAECFNHSYVNKEKLANNYSEHVVKHREKNVGLHLTFSSLFIGLLKLMNICMKFNWPTSSILSCDIPPLHNR